MEEKESIEFSAKYKTWLSVKKMSINEATNPAEVVGHLVSIRQTASKKAFEYTGIDTAALDSYAEQITKGARKSFSTLAEMAAKLGDKDAKEAISKAAKDKKLEAMAFAYLFKKVMNNLGFDTEINQDMFDKAYPEYKLKKPPGRMKK